MHMHTFCKYSHNNKLSNTCTEVIQAPCVDYQGELGDNTKITSDCVNIENVAEDLYQITDEIIENMSVSEIGNSCISFQQEPTRVADVLKKYEEEICNLKQQVETLQTNFICNVDISDCGLNLSNLQPTNDTPCTNPLQTLKDVLQAIIDKL